MKQMTYYWYCLLVFKYLYKRDCWITSVYYKGSYTTRRMRSWEELKQYLKISKKSIKRHFLSANYSLNEKQLHELRW